MAYTAQRPSLLVDLHMLEVIIKVEPYSAPDFFRDRVNVFEQTPVIGYRHRLL